MTTKERDALLLAMSNELKVLTRDSTIQTTELKVIKEQVIKTNGRVTYLEDDRVPKLEHWQSRNTGRNQVILAVVGGTGVLLGIVATIIASL